jgi:hypothetical protein
MDTPVGPAAARGVPRGRLASLSKRGGLRHQSCLAGQPPAFGLPFRHFQPFPAPDPIDALDADAPAFVDQQLADPPIAIAAVLLGEPHDGFGQRCLVVTDLRLSALRCAGLSDNRTRPTLRDGKLRAHVIHARPLPGRA